MGIHTAQLKLDRVTMGLVSNGDEGFTCFLLGTTLARAAQKGEHAEALGQIRWLLRLMHGGVVRRYFMGVLGSCVWGCWGERKNKK